MRESPDGERAACLRFDQELEGYLEGEAQPFVVAHASQCLRCDALLRDLKLIQLTAREMALEEPPPSVWANVRAHLEAEGVFQPPVSVWQRILAWRRIPHPVPVGVLGMLMLLGGALSLPPYTGPGWDAPDSAALSPRSATAVTLPLGEEESLARLVRELESNYRANQASISPDLKAVYEKSLLSLDDSIRECLDSLQHEPRNSATHDYLLTAYTRKAEVLSTALEFHGR